MDNRLRSALVVLAIGVLWAILWAAIGISIALFALVVQPEVIGPGEGPVDIALILGPLGLPAGIVFGGVVTILERGRTLADVGLVQALGLGIVAAATVGFVAGLPASAIANACVLGAVAGPASIAIRRVVTRRRALSA